MAHVSIVRYRYKMTASNDDDDDDAADEEEEEKAIHGENWRCRLTIASTTKPIQLHARTIITRCTTQANSDGYYRTNG